ncbi:Predicted alpha-1,6-mannanase, GH76 family [Amycolatopsis arida]|uniref:Predicted alpha-1,6-mannanase, GH76 family n=1 Tax=Amycolatopsis arida TaxID=587909 RepID=A0A1I5ZE88_9PSEU|nr:glycoside hydrolase family 76 protein [Amycolatopsis arida]TDX89571.1 putative alpha-1,6-mannanase (GH76 family) [Amycolatopsis arida]SFQ54741.1 Predicted alpha-1,6-mannanase, GH76 family [Amycolatopsis arida]
MRGALRALVGALAGVLVLSGVAVAAPGAPYGRWARTAGTVLAGWYDPATGLYDTTNWWNAANALNAEIDLSRRHGLRVGAEHAAITYDRHHAGGFLNHYYDDEGWWALTWINAHDLTGDPRYLATARGIFADLLTGWDDVCGGGLWWNKDRRYKNAITNELFITVATRLAARTPGPAAAEYLGWARRGWAWFAASGMINSSGLVNDGLDDACANNGQPTWTYNQGVILGALTDLTRLTGDRTLLATAHRIAGAAITTVIHPGGILREPCEPDHCGADGPQFKGIFMRNLGHLHTHSPRARYADFVRANARSLWRHGRSAADEIGLVWIGPFDTADAARQSSALDALNAAANL